MRPSRRSITTNAMGCIDRPSPAAASLMSQTRWAAGVLSRPGPQASCPFRSPLPKTRCAVNLRSSRSITTRPRSSGTVRRTSRRRTSSRRIGSSYPKFKHPAVRRRVVATLRNVAEELAARVADGLGMSLPEPLPRAVPRAAKPEVEVSPSLSLMARPGNGGIATRHVAILIEEGFDSAAILAHAVLLEKGAVPRFVGPRLGTFKALEGSDVEAEISLEASPAVVYDAVILPGGPAAERLARNGAAVEFVKDMYRHCKAILAAADAEPILDRVGIPDTLPEDSGLIRTKGVDPGGLDRFITAIAAHRAFERETDPPLV